MNDSELNDLLRCARVPERSEEQWNDFPEDTMRRVRLSLPPPRVRAEGLRPRWRSMAGWVSCCAGVCVLVALTLACWRSGRTKPNNNVAGAQKLFSELSEMFPNQLEAVVLDGSTPRLVLAEKTSENKGTPLFVRLCGAQGCQRVITFSGQRVLLNGESYEVLMDARGRVIVSGDHFVWLSGDGAPVHGGYRIEATQLEGAL